MERPPKPSRKAKVGSSWMKEAPLWIAKRHPVVISSIPASRAGANSGAIPRKANSGDRSRDNPSMIPRCLSSARMTEKKMTVPPIRASVRSIPKSISVKAGVFPNVGGRVADSEAVRRRQPHNMPDSRPAATWHSQRSSPRRRSPSMAMPSEPMMKAGPAWEASLAVSCTASGESTPCRDNSPVMRAPAG